MSNREEDGGNIIQVRESPGGPPEEDDMSNQEEDVSGEESVQKNKIGHIDVPRSRRSPVVVEVNVDEVFSRSSSKQRQRGVPGFKAQRQ